MSTITLNFFHSISRFRLFAQIFLIAQTGPGVGRRYTKDNESYFLTTTFALNSTSQGPLRVGPKICIHIYIYIFLNVLTMRVSPDVIVNRNNWSAFQITKRESQTRDLLHESVADATKYQYTPDDILKPTHLPSNLMVSHVTIPLYETERTRRDC